MSTRPAESGPRRASPRRPLTLTPLTLTPLTLPPLALALTLAVAAFCQLPAPAAAQQAVPLYLQPPTDLMFVKGRPVPYVCRTLTNLPQRYMAELPRSGVFKFSLANPDTSKGEPVGETGFRWAVIERFQVFEVGVLEEAQQLINEQRYDDAFPYLDFLAVNYPKVPGLEGVVNSYLYAAALDLFAKKRYSEALSTVEELYRRDSNYVHEGQHSVSSAISSISDRLIASYSDAEDLDSARDLLRRLVRQYGPELLPATRKWIAQFDQRASGKRDQLRQELADGKLRDAFITSGEMLKIWPDVAGGRELALEASRRYPIVKVAVLDQPASGDMSRMDDWGARRLARLQGRLLVEYVEPGPAGGKYVSPYGVIDHSDDLSAMFLQLNRPRTEDERTYTAYEIGQRLRDMADPGSPAFSPQWAGLFGGVEVGQPYELSARLRRSNVLPEAMLQVPAATQSWEKPPYLAPEREGQSARFVFHPDYAFRGTTQPAEIVEQWFEFGLEAVEAMREGRIDVIDRLFPGDAAKLLRDTTGEIRVRPYATPTIHVLIPNYENPYLARESFRRAICYALPRERILRELILDNQDLPGAVVVSGPFPTASYAYLESAAPLPYDPLLGKLLTLVTGNELQQIAEKTKKPAPPFKPLVIGHPPTRVARQACHGISVNLKALGIDNSVKEFGPGQVRDSDGSCDLVYAELMMPEPLVDAERLLAVSGLAKSPSPYIGLGLRRVGTALDWREAALRLQDLHRTCLENMPVIPLYQIPEHYVTRPGVSGISEGAFTLYQDIERWLIEPRLLVE